MCSRIVFNENLHILYLFKGTRMSRKPPTVAMNTCCESFHSIKGDDTKVAIARNPVQKKESTLTYPFTMYHKSRHGTSSTTC